MKMKRSIQEISLVLILLAAIIVLFQWYTTQNRVRIEERNKNYAANSAHMKAEQIDEELSNARNRISTYSYFIGEGLSEPAVTAQMLEKIEENSMFDAVLFTGTDGIDYTSDGRTADVKDRDFYQDGMKGDSGISIILIPTFLMKR